MKSLDRTAHASRPEYDVHLTENVMVPMRDGVRMATDVYRPARDGRPLADRRPVLLHRTPYNQVETEATSGQCRYFAASRKGSRQAGSGLSFWSDSTSAR